MAENGSVGLGKPIPPAEGSLFLSLGTGPLTELGERYVLFVAFVGGLLFMDELFTN